MADAATTPSALAEALDKVSAALANVTDALAKMERRLAQEKARLEILTKVSDGQERHLANLRRGESVVSLPEFGKMRLSMSQHRSTCVKLRSNIAILTVKVGAAQKDQKLLKEEHEELRVAQANRGKIIQFRGRQNG